MGYFCGISRPKVSSPPQELKHSLKSLKMNLILTIPIIMTISTMLKSDLLGVPFQTPNLWVQILFFQFSKMKLMDINHLYVVSTVN